MDRIAILRFENLGQDRSADWIGRAFSDVIAAELNGVPGVYPLPASRLHGLDRLLGAHPISSPGISSERTQAVLAGAAHIGYGDYAIRGGRLEARLTLEDARTGKMTQVISAFAPAGDVLAAATELARQVALSRQTAGASRQAPLIARYGTRNEQALRAYVVGTEDSDPADAEAALTLAIAGDPDFAAPYELLAQFRGQRQNRAGALAVLEQAAARGNAIPEVDRARMEVIAAGLRGDSVARQNALASVVKLDPGDSTSWRSLGEAAQNGHQYPLAMQALQKVTELEPGDTTAFNMLGYDATYAGDLEAGMAALRRYQALRPKDANPLDSMGDINLAAGRLEAAESFYLQAQKKDRTLLNDGELLKAALARLMTGDVTSADGLAKQYLDARGAAQDPAVAYRQAEWSWISGRRKAACQQLAAFAASAQNAAGAENGAGQNAARNGSLRELASRANAELAIWNLMLGDRASAANTARQALALAGPGSVAVALVAQFLTQPPATPAEWTARAQQRFSGVAQSGIQDFALAYALLLNRQFQAAELLLKRMWDNPALATDEGLPVLLAWTYLETGHLTEAAPLLAFNPTPGQAVIGPFTPFYLPRLFYLRGLAAEKQAGTPDVGATSGHTSAAQSNSARTSYGLFLKLSGPDPLIWGEERKAEAASR